MRLSLRLPNWRAIRLPVSVASRPAMTAGTQRAPPPNPATTRGCRTWSHAHPEGAPVPMPSFDERDTPARVATADPPPAPRRAASRGRPPRPPWRTVALAALAVGMVSVLVLIGLFAAPGGARFIVERLGQSITTPLPTATIPPAGTPAPGPPTPSPQGTVGPGTLASPQGCGPRGARPQPPSHIISSAAGYSGAHGEVALTFDDGPAPIFTRQILDELRAAGAHATFFVVGEHAQRYPDLVRAELAGGNAVGNHTFT